MDSCGEGQRYKSNEIFVGDDLFMSEPEDVLGPTIGPDNSSSQKSNDPTIRGKSPWAGLVGTPSCLGLLTMGVQ